MTRRFPNICFLWLGCCWQVQTEELEGKDGQNLADEEKTLDSEASSCFMLPCIFDDNFLFVVATQHWISMATLTVNNEDARSNLRALVSESVVSSLCEGQWNVGGSRSKEDGAQEPCFTYNNVC